MRPNAKPGVVGLTLRRDGKTLVVPSGDAKIRFIDLTTGNVERTFTGHTNFVYMAVFSPDDKLMASSSRDNTARVWDVASGRELYKFTGFRCAVKTVGFSPDGRTVAAAGNDGMLKIWDLKTGKELQSFVHINSADIDMSVYSFAFNRAGDKIYGANGDGTISEWDIAKQKETRVWKAHNREVFRLQFSPDYSLLASQGGSSLKLWDTSTWHEARDMTLTRSAGENTIPSMISFSHDGRLIAASNAGMDQNRANYSYVQTTVWNVQSGAKLFTLEGHKFDVNGLVFTRDDRLLLTGSVDTTIKFWDMKTGSETRTISLSATTK